MISKLPPSLSSVPAEPKPDSAIRNPHPAMGFTLRPYQFEAFKNRTSGIEVFGVMDGAVDLVLDAGTVAGAGATTIDVTEVYWRVIKEGAIAPPDFDQDGHSDC